MCRRVAISFISETWRDGSHGWSAAVDGSPFLQEEQTRGGGGLPFM